MKKRVLAMMLVSVMAVSLAACGTSKTKTEEGATESTTETAETSTTATEGDVVSNDLFAITLPAECTDKYVAEVTDTGIMIYDKESKEANFGGFTFGVTAYENPKDHATDMEIKMGELTTTDGVVYDITMSQPSDVQYDYENNEEMPETYAALYNGKEDIIKGLQGQNGATFVWEGGTRGEDLYKDVLAKHVQAINEKWDAKKLEGEEMSTMYAAVAENSDKPLESIGYIYKDLNHDGIDELLIGEIADGEWKGIVYDIYTVVNREPAHVLSGSDKDRYFVNQYGAIIKEFNNGEKETGYMTYDLAPNTTELWDQVAFKTDENAKEPWFVSYDNGETWEEASEEDYTMQLNNFLPYEELEYTALSTIK